MQILVKTNYLIPTALIISVSIIAQTVGFVFSPMKMKDKNTIHDRLEFRLQGRAKKKPGGIPGLYVLYLFSRPFPVNSECALPLYSSSKNKIR